MPTQLTAAQNHEARIFLARRAGERVLTSENNGVGVRRAHEMINLSAMTDRKFLEFLQCRDTLNNSLSLMDKNEYMAIPASARQYADNLAFEMVLESNILNHKEDLDSLPNLTAQFVANEIIKNLKANGFTANSNDGETVTVGKIRNEMIDIFRDHNLTDTIEESVDKIKQAFSEAGLSFIKPGNHQPELELEPEPELEPEDKPWAKKVVIEPTTEPTVVNNNESDEQFVVVPNNKLNNMTINSLVTASLMHTAEMPLDKRSAHLAQALADINVYYTASLSILASLPKNELVEESAANILTPLEEVEFNSSLDDNDPTLRIMAVKLVKSMKKLGISHAIDRDSSIIAELDMTVDNPKQAPSQAPKVEVEAASKVIHMPRKRY